MTNTNTKEVEEKKVISPILVKDMQLLNYAHQIHVCITREALSKKEMENPDTWVFVAKKIRMHDRVQVMDSQASVLGEGIVTYVSGNHVKVQIYSYHKLNASDQAEIEYRDFLIRWGGVSSKWIVVNKVTGETLRGDFSSSEVAVRWVTDHYKALNP